MLLRIDLNEVGFSPSVCFSHNFYCCFYKNNKKIHINVYMCVFSDKTKLQKQVKYTINK